LDIRQIRVTKDILSANSKTAEGIRSRLDGYPVRMINIMSSPGAGKTSLITRTINFFKGTYRIAVIEGDIASSIDAESISKLNVPAIQINTGGGCHLDANMIEKALADLELDDLDLIFVENVGNLVCTADFDLGAHKNAVILSVPEGDDKPYKYPVIFVEADVVLINKIDVLPYFDFDLDSFPEIMNGLNPSTTVLSVSAKSGEGLDGWFAWIERTLGQDNI
jgi:hydrogenase nickel incorporation protein HypB